MFSHALGVASNLGAQASSPAIWERKHCVMAKGDHIKVRRHGLVYAHHGVDMGDGSVIHFTEPKEDRPPAIRRTAMDEFLRGGKLRTVKHRKALAPDEICERALEALGGDGYNLVTNNCEHFANWCVTGKKKSFQVLRAAGAVAGAVAVAVVVAAGRGRRRA